MKIVILDAATLGADIDLGGFIELGEVVKHPLTLPHQVAERIDDCDVCIVNKVKLNEDVLKGAKKLKLICVSATGYDNIDTQYCKGRGIAVCNVAGYSVNSVSQLTLAMVLSASVNLWEYKQSVCDGSYTSGGVQNILTPVYHELCGKVWGIIGYGAIGKKVGDAAKALGCRVVVNKRTPIAEEECLSLEELIKISDIITIHTPLTEETRNLIGEKEIALMKDGVFLVNVARGAVTDEGAVAKAIENGKIGFFGCDVYSQEPMPKDNPLFAVKDRKNVCLTPHMAWGAYESRMRCVDEMCKNIISFFKGESRNRIV
ncbi:MAG: hydroxyacid dehydrogenase [Clostridia bacterium]|nr:hydroxyacid dehydrogenase [Clostridia bacterium]